MNSGTLGVKSHLKQVFEESQNIWYFSAFAVFLKWAHRMVYPTAASITNNFIIDRFYDQNEPMT